MKNILLLVALVALLTACIEDNFSTSTTDVLEFSTDSVKFDTVITAQSTPTKQFVVYNRGKKQLRISSIKMAGRSDKGHFYLNVDGVKGTEFHDVEVRGNDSIYVFVESYLDEMRQDAPVEISDLIEFETNGVKQQVVAHAWGQDVVRLHGDTIGRSVHFTADKPYLIYDTLFVALGATLTLDAGATLLFHDKGAMRVAGRLVANGTQERPVVLRGDRLDHVVGTINFDIMSGQWGGVIFTPPTRLNELHHVTMSGSSIGMHVSASDTLTRALYLHNCVLHNASTSVFTSGGAWVDAVGTEFSDAAESVVNFIGGKVNLVQCTLANYYLFKAPTDPIIFVYLQDDDHVVDELKARFDNCVIYGNTSEINMGDLTGTDVMLRYCLLKSAGDDDANFISCVWQGDPKFYTEREKYIFDYRLHDESDAIGRGNPALCPASARYDRYGQDRLARGGSVDLGAYTWIPEN